jgi:hypothetical protein
LSSEQNEKAAHYLSARLLVGGRIAPSRDFSVASHIRLDPLVEPVHFFFKISQKADLALSPPMLPRQTTAFLRKSKV